MKGSCQMILSRENKAGIVFSHFSTTQRFNLKRIAPLFKLESVLMLAIESQ